MEIAVAETGYGGLSSTVLLAQHHKFVALDIIPEKVVRVSQHKSPIVDVEIEDFSANRMIDGLAGVDIKVYPRDLFGGYSQ